jgi:hypothetical protein
MWTGSSAAGRGRRTRVGGRDVSAEQQPAHEISASTRAGRKRSDAGAEVRGLGLDGGGVVRFSDERAVGATGRVFVAMAGSFAIFARYAYLDASDDEHVVQLGVTIKFPLGPPFGAATH